MKRSKWILLATILIIVAAISVTIALVPWAQAAQVRISYQPSWHHVAFFIMAEKGWLQKVLGDRINVTLREFPSGPPQMEAMVAGELDVVYVGAAPPLSVIAKGFKAKMVAVANTEGSSLVVRPDFRYEGPASLIGRSVSVYPPGSIQDTLLKYWLLKNNISIDKVRIINQRGPAEQLESLRAGALDAILTPDPAPYIAVLEGYGKIAITSRHMWPQHPCCVVLMTEEFIRKHRDLAVKLIALHIIASEYAMDPKNRDEVKQILIKWLGIRREVAEMFPGSTNLMSDPRNLNWLEGLDYMCEVHYQLGLTKTAEGRPVRLKAGDIVDSSLYEEALKIVPQIKAILGLG
ncbi:MAG: ABC transporter substrate-binding protein [Candidatus Nezhaarchaeota archaeon]|nr:ABC transporter substrate-binding protein [Candidatus Nezhaarchaeota archaeon]MCX8142381.1 ABC transporter substrate-binding protein [Candidatus Nezhaarchaeota archaeon]MDW8050646.1 ABC transporter substrate-binding protein [Nitrososphaerota archaeon]